MQFSCTLSDSCGPGPNTGRWKAQIVSNDYPAACCTCVRCMYGTRKFFAIFHVIGRLDGVNCWRAWIRGDTSLERGSRCLCSSYQRVNRVSFYGILLSKQYDRFLPLRRRFVESTYVHIGASCHFSVIRREVSASILTTSRSICNFGLYFARPLHI